MTTKRFKMPSLTITIPGSNHMNKKSITGRKSVDYVISTTGRIRGEFSTDSVVFLWKSILNRLKNAFINIPLLFILFHKSVNKGIAICGKSVRNLCIYCGINDDFCSDLSEHKLNTVLVICQPPVTNYNGTYLS